jgi:predicted GNAT family acetyltransferase
MSERFDVVHNAAEHRFEIRQGDALAKLEYEMRGSDTIDLVHTVVPASLEGGGYGSALAKAALEYARANGLRVIPTCAFVNAYVRRHPEYADLTATNA